MLRLKKIDLNSNTQTLFYLLLISFLVFGYSLTFDFFIFDDNFHIMGNKSFDASDPLKMFAHWKNPFMPLTYTVWGGIIYLFGKESPFYFHLLNILFHTANSFLVFLWIKEVFRIFNFSNDKKKMTSAAFLSAIVFLIHPQKVEAVVWVSALKDLQSFHLGLLSFIIFLRSRDDDKLLFLSLFILILAALSKLNAAIFLLSFMFVEFFFFKFKKNRFFLHAGASVFSLYLFFWFYKISMVENLFKSPDLLEKTSMAALSLIFYLKKMFLPFNLSFDYGLNFLSPIDKSSILIAILLILCLFSFTVMRIRNQKRVDLFSFSIILFFILSLPILGFVPFVFQNISNVADRFSYIPSLAFSLACAAFYARFSNLENDKKFSFIFAIVILTLTILCMKQVFRWKTNESILAHSFNLNKKSYFLATSLAADSINNMKWRQSIGFYKAAYTINDADPDPLDKIIAIYEHIGHNEGPLITIYEERIRNRQRHGVPPLDYFQRLIEIYIGQGNREKANRYLKKLSKIAPNSPQSKEAALAIKKIEKERLKR